jgi:hypothetical protein
MVLIHSKSKSLIFLIVFSLCDIGITEQVFRRHTVVRCRISCASNSGGLTAQAPQAVAWAASAATMDRSKQTSYPQASKQSSKGSRHMRRV